MGFHKKKETMFFSIINYRFLLMLTHMHKPIPSFLLLAVLQPLFFASCQQLRWNVQNDFSKNSPTVTLVLLACYHISEWNVGWMYGRSFCLKVFQHVRPPLITATCNLLDFLFVNNNCTQYKLNRNISCFFGFQRVKSWMLKQVPFCVCSLMNKMFLTDKHLSFCTNFCTWSSKKKLANSKMFGFKFGIHLSKISC